MTALFYRSTLKDLLYPSEFIKEKQLSDMMSAISRKFVHVMSFKLFEDFLLTPFFMENRQAKITYLNVDFNKGRECFNNLCRFQSYSALYILVMETVFGDDYFDEYLPLAQALKSDRAMSSKPEYFVPFRVRDSVGSEGMMNRSRRGIYDTSEFNVSAFSDNIFRNTSKVRYSYRAFISDSYFDLLKTHIRLFGIDAGASYLGYLLHKIPKSFHNEGVPFDYLVHILSRAIADEMPGKSPREAYNSALTAAALMTDLGRISTCITELSPKTPETLLVLYTYLRKSANLVNIARSGEQSVHHFSLLPTPLLYYTAEISKLIRGNSEYLHIFSKLYSTYRNIIRASITDPAVRLAQDFYYKLLLFDNNPPDRVVDYEVLYMQQEGQPKFNFGNVPSYTNSLIHEQIKPIYEQIKHSAGW